MFRQFIYSLIAGIILVLSSQSYAEEEKKPQGMPPARVVVAEVVTGKVAPESEFIGTVYYQEVSDVASEVSGKVEEVSFEEGQRIKKGHVLARLISDLLEKNLQAMQAGYEQVLSDLDKARRDLDRAENLFKNELVTEQTYDDRRFAVSGLEKRVISLEADVERLKVELLKKMVRAPFDGVVLKKHVDRGEWLDEGSTVATIAFEENIDIVADVSQQVVRYVKQGMNVKVKTGSGTITGKVIALIPRGDISTRTFPVKLRAKNSLSLVEGMEARVTLPTGKKEDALIVPRDAVITARGSTVVYTVNDSKASIMPVRVIGYEGMTAGIAANGLQQGMTVVIKGNERLRPGQEVMIQK
jgi:RND family efflux transporter MFP subunit